MTVEQQKQRRRAELEHQLNMAIRAPYLFGDEEQRFASIDFIRSSIAELDKPEKPREMENTLRPGRVQLRAQLKRLVTLILTHG
ncbi:hypothetical protein ACFSR7_12440 [Cohnella sp. GCM10020058]|uniref:hypothetical protein n=1 Tax=Cohnella sp. GCM10020058 TaxID=3317330 RepID=UPI0036275FF1